MLKGHSSFQSLRGQDGRDALIDPLGNLEARIEAHKVLMTEVSGYKDKHIRAISVIKRDLGESIDREGFLAYQKLVTMSEERRDKAVVKAREAEDALAKESSQDSVTLVDDGMLTPAFVQAKQDAIFAVWDEYLIKNIVAHEAFLIYAHCDNLIVSYEGKVNSARSLTDVELRSLALSLDDAEFVSSAVTYSALNSFEIRELESVLKYLPGTIKAEGLIRYNRPEKQSVYNTPDFTYVEAELLSIESEFGLRKLLNNVDTTPDPLSDLRLEESDLGYELWKSLIVLRRSHEEYMRSQYEMRETMLVGLDSDYLSQLQEMEGLLLAREKAEQQEFLAQASYHLVCHNVNNVFRGDRTSEEQLGRAVDAVCFAINKVCGANAQVVGVISDIALLNVNRSFNLHASMSPPIMREQGTEDNTMFASLDPVIELGLNLKKLYELGERSKDVIDGTISLQLSFSNSLNKISERRVSINDEGILLVNRVLRKGLVEDKDTTHLAEVEQHAGNLLALYDALPKNGQTIPVLNFNLTADSHSVRVTQKNASGDVDINFTALQPKTVEALFKALTNQALVEQYSGRAEGSGVISK